MAVNTTAELVSLLRQLRLLTPAALEELPGRCSSPRELAGELIKRGLLTPYQVNLIFLDRGQELVLGSYVLLERLGEGGMGTVYKARHLTMNRLVALKVIRKERLQSSDAARRFDREIKAAAQLSHANIVLAFDADALDRPGSAGIDIDGGSARGVVHLLAGRQGERGGGDGGQGIGTAHGSSPL